MRAISFAADKHRNQRRKDVDKTPYINHPIEVANILMNEGGIDNPVIIIGAILHDTVEDTDTTIAEIESLFGRDVANVVHEVTDDASLTKEQMRQSQIDNVKNKSICARLIKLADKLHNIRDIRSHPPVQSDAQGDVD